MNKVFNPGECIPSNISTNSPFSSTSCKMSPASIESSADIKKTLLFRKIVINGSKIVRDK